MSKYIRVTNEHRNASSIRALVKHLDDRAHAIRDLDDKRKLVKREIAQEKTLQGHQTNELIKALGLPLEGDDWLMTGEHEAVSVKVLQTVLQSRIGTQATFMVYGVDKRQGVAGVIREQVQADLYALMGDGYVLEK